MTGLAVSSSPPRVPPGRDPVTGLFEVYGGRILGLSLKLCGHRHDAEDVVQETFIQAHRKWSQFQGRSDPGTWLFTIAARLCAKRIRSRSRRAMPAFSELAPFGDTTVADVRAGADSPLERQITREAIEGVGRAIVRLPPAFRLPLVLKDIVELPVAGVAEILGLRPATVKTRVHRARLMLRRSLMRHVPQRPAPAPTYERQVCIDLLTAKLEAMDRGRGFPLEGEVVCERCRGVLAELDLTQSACAALAEGDVPAALRRLVMEALRSGGTAGTARRRRKG